MSRIYRVLFISFLLLLTTQLVFAGRYYDSETGRWLSVDPKADKYPGWSPYNYCLNNPLKFTDPDGNAPWVAAPAAAVGTLELVTGGLILTAGILSTVGADNTASAITSAADWIDNNLTQPIIDLFPGNDMTHTSFPVTQGEGINKTTIAPADMSGVIINILLEENTNPYQGPVSSDVIVVDGNGNAIPVKTGEQIKTSPDGNWVDVKKTDGKSSTKTRIDNGHPGHTDPRAHKPHTHRDGVKNPDGTPWLPIK